jgi:NADPH-dependent 2,4-dienoyl-CoA reductase/sulfur reductase-like enzyme/ferredoxin
MEIKNPSVFLNFNQLRERSYVPLWVWSWVRLASVLAALGYAAALIVAPQIGLFIFWKLTVPLLPLVFWIAPGLWRNACPLAAVNQLPRVFKFTLGRATPGWFTEYGFVIAMAAFFTVVATRKWLFNTSGLATGAMVLAGLGCAFVGGWLFKGKSGWCSSICPLYPLQRLYNQTPWLVVPNSHCTPCLGCTKNCYDFNPNVAYLADLYDEDRYYVNYRRFFAAAMPGFIVAYFTLPDPPAVSIPAMYALFALYIVVSVGLFSLLDTFLKTTTNKLTAVFGAAALNLFYGFGLPPWIKTVGSLFGAVPPVWVAWIGQAAIAAATLAWIARTYRKEPLFLRALKQQQPKEETRIASGVARLLKQAAEQEQAEITFADSGARVLAEPGRTLLEMAEANNLPIESGCRMGMCGSDPVMILNGMTNLSPISAEERETLQRLGYGGNVRLACMCRARGPVSVSLNAKGGGAVALSLPKEIVAYDRAIRSVVIIGNGIAGVTAADYLRRHHPKCEIHLVARERHHLYNRMAITRLIYGRSAMSRLYLQKDSWYDERGINCWLNTQATHIDRKARTVALATGEHLPYDRLILACGSSGAVPPIAGYGLPGTFALREAEEAMQMRSFVQSRGCHNAVVAGGGLLGLETSYALHKLGLEVTVLERGEWLLRRQLDERGGRFLRQYLEQLGLEVMLRAEVGAAQGDGQVRQVALKDGRVLLCDLLVTAAGIAPNAELARSAGLEVNCGVVVDAAMRTSDPDIYAAGDVCEFNQGVQGLWPVAVEQARIAALNALGGQEAYKDIVPATVLKVVGIDLISIGRFEPSSEADTVIVFEDSSQHRYRKLVISENRIVGAILLGYPQDAHAVAEAVKRARPVGDCLAALRAGKWEALREEAA